jgi:hypothetical protein
MILDQLIMTPLGNIFNTLILMHDMIVKVSINIL